MKILVLGVSGLIGSTIFRILSHSNDWRVSGTARTGLPVPGIPSRLEGNIIKGGDVRDTESLNNLLATLQPNIIINCIGVTKHHVECTDPLISIPVNSILPHRLAQFCDLNGSKLIHISTDCVFEGTLGLYSEEDAPDSQELYGMSKALGEVKDSSNITLRTSTIGHESESSYGLLEWFLSQKESCKGFSKAIFSGLPTVVLAEIIRDFVIPNEQLAGLYNVASEPIDKYTLLHLISRVYSKEIRIIEERDIKIDRSLNASKFKNHTGYIAPSWETLITMMHKDYLGGNNV